MNEAPLARRCVGTNRAGDRCARAPIPGGQVCVLHGGRAPQVQQSAKQRLLAMVDPAFDALLRALASGPPCAACGRSDSDRDPAVIRAAQIVLDRAGFHPSLTVEHVETSALGVATLDELIDRAERTLADLHAIRDAERAALPEAIDVPEDDVYVVPEDDAEPRSIPTGDVTKEPGK